MASLDEELEDSLDDLEPQEGTVELYEHFRVVADRGQSLLRVDKFLFEHLEHASRNRIQKAAEAGMVMVGGKPVKSNYRVKPLDVVTVMMDRPRYSTEITPEDIPLDIVYEDDCLLVVNKPAGLVVHPGCGNYSGTLVNALAWHLRDNPDYDPNSPQVGLVHRIDKDTSGLLVVAKTPFAKTFLGKQFFDKTTRRTYQALVWGQPDPSEGTVESQIIRNPKDRLQMAVSFDPSEGKHAVTHYRTLERFGYTTLVECRLETGRTHQIRVHMKHIGHPLFSDERYGGNIILKGTTFAPYRHFVEECFSTCPRQALHARTLGFVHPVTGQEMFFTSEMPDDMASLLGKWRDYTEKMNK
ncbi:MAG: RluA family pseudouridine synthase [Bacteroidaceae bacterium]|nr:RluA family pseudouridine synthase [Bacteroidaceae bacterium]